MRIIALINQKGGVGKTTTTVNLGAGLAALGKRVVIVDLDPQANLTLHLGLEGTGTEEEHPSIYDVLIGRRTFADAIRPTGVEGLSAVGSHIDLSGAEMELAGAFGRETLLRDAVAEWRKSQDEEPADYVLLDCPPSLGLLAINGLAAAGEVFLVVQTEFFALQGMSKLVEIVQLVQRRIHPELEVTGIVPCLYDSRLRLAREVLGELRNYFPGLVFRHSIGTNVKLAEAPSFSQTIFQYAPESAGARDYRALSQEVLAMEESPEPAPTAADGSESSSQSGTEELRVEEITPPQPATTDEPV